MKRAAVALGALGGLLLSVLAGCNSVDLGLGLALTGAEAAANVRIMDGSPDVVAVTLQNSLKRQGFDATISKSSDTVVVWSNTGAGSKFGLVLKSMVAPDGHAQTHVSLEWMDSKGDQQTSVKIFAGIDQQAAAKK